MLTPLSRPIVLIESPFHHTHSFGKQMHCAYLELCFLDSISRGECPVATHKLYTTCLDDTVPAERQLGMELLLLLMSQTDYHAVYYDLGISRGMEWGIKSALRENKKFHLRSLYNHSIPSELQSIFPEGKVP